MTQYHVLTSEGRQRYTIYTKTPKNIQEKKNNCIQFCIAICSQFAICYLSVVICHLASFFVFLFVLFAWSFRTRFCICSFCQFCFIRLFNIRSFSVIFVLIREMCSRSSDKSINIIRQGCAIFCLSLGSESLLQSYLLVGYPEPISLTGLEEGETT